MGQNVSLHKSNIEQQHRPILDQPPADWIYDRDTVADATFGPEYVEKV
jgi:hypothetical protein